ncbi:hypothetical protein ACF07W_13885 [Streptomyces sp. NPDC015140]|uniref:hypothetical protein n=1 Tax=unclassified Streptomyces TaxID=2593676 RepID=UPI0036F52B21
MKPEVAILFSVIIAFGLLCAAFPKRLMELARRGYSPPWKRVRLLRFLGVVIIVTAAVILFLSRDNLS